MECKVIDGKAVAADIRAQVAMRVEALKAKGVMPALSVILVGDNPASVSYVTGGGAFRIAGGGMTILFR